MAEWLGLDRSLQSKTCHRLVELDPALFQADCSNLEDFTTYTWASVSLVREGVYEVSNDVMKEEIKYV